MNYGEIDRELSRVFGNKDFQNTLDSTIRKVCRMESALREIAAWKGTNLTDRLQKIAREAIEYDGREP